MKQKYNLGDIVFRMNENKIISEPIKGVYLFDDLFSYMFKIEGVVYRHDWIPESEIFPSKEELIKSL